MSEDRSPRSFRLLIVPGVTVDRWQRTWSERRPGVALELVPTGPVPPDGSCAALLDGRADAGLLRLPVDRDACHAIPLYTEVTVVVVPRDHVLTVADELTLADLAGETLVRPADDVLAWPAPSPVAADDPAPDRPGTTAEAVQLVAAGCGVLVVPQSLARAHHRRDLVYRPVTDAPTSTVAFVWHRDRHTDLVEEMIGVVRGRTVNSTRGQVGTAEAAPRRTPSPERSGGARSGGARSGGARSGGARSGGTRSGDPRTGQRRRGR